MLFVPDTRCGISPQNSVLNLKCPFGTVISDIKFASYGTAVGDCGNFTTGTCHEPMTKEIVADVCVGEQSCSIAASSKVFGDPCPVIAKSLRVQAVCEGAPPFLPFECRKPLLSLLPRQITGAPPKMASIFARVVVQYALVLGDICGGGLRVGVWMLPYVVQPLPHADLPAPSSHANAQKASESASARRSVCCGCIRVARTAAVLLSCMPLCQMLHGMLTHILMSSPRRLAKPRSRPEF